MNLEKLLENYSKLLEIALDSDNINIQYSNINGEEKLIVNGKDFTETFDDSEIKERISNFKANMDELDSCTLTEACDKISEHICLKDFDDFLNKEHYTEKEANNMNELLDKVCELIREHINEKINTLENLYTLF